MREPWSQWARSSTVNYSSPDWRRCVWGVRRHFARGRNTRRGTRIIGWVVEWSHLVRLSRTMHQSGLTAQYLRGDFEVPFR